MTLGEYVKAYRKMHGWSQREFANRSGLSNTYISNLERGTNSNGSVTSPSLETYQVIAKVTGCTASDLIDLLDENSKKEPVQLHAQTEDPEETRLLTLWRRADEIDRGTIWNILGRYDKEEDQAPVPMIRHYLVPAAAGYASPIEGEDYEEIPLPKDAPHGADFCITIRGDSMEPYIPDGSLVFVRRNAELQRFEPGVFFVDGDVFCKQWCPGYAGETYLLSANPRREDANITITRDSGRNLFYFGKVLLPHKLPQPEYV